MAVPDGPWKIICRSGFGGSSLAAVVFSGAFPVAVGAFPVAVDAVLSGVFPAAVGAAMSGKF